MDGRDLSWLQQALRCLEPLQDDGNWYDETPKDGEPNVAAWRGKGTPEEMARIAHRNVQGVISRYVGQQTKGRAE